MGFYRGPKIVTEGLVLYLDAANPKSYIGSGTTWNDLTTNYYNGTLINGPTFDTGNKGSIVFDGVDDIATVDTVDFNSNTTWCAWVNRSSIINTYNMFMGKSLPYFGIRSNNLVIFSNKIGGVQRTLQSTLLDSPDGEWYNLSFTTNFDGTNTTMKVFVNGEETDSGSWAGSYSTSSGVKFTLGDGRNTSTWYPFNGKISLIKVYNKTLSSEEILQNFNATKSRFGL